MEYTVSVPVGLVLRTLWAVMPPWIEFGSPVQRARSDNEAESFWHVPVRVWPMLFKRMGPGEIYGCRAFLEFDGKEIPLYWGDWKFGKCYAAASLTKGVPEMIPVIYRSEADKDRNAYIADSRFHEQGTRHYPVLPDREKHLCRLIIRRGTKRYASPHRYVIRVPKGRGNGHFTMEIEYDRKETQRA